MPNYTRLEAELLTSEQGELIASSRAEALRALPDEELYQAIARLKTAIDEAGPAGTPDTPTAADLLNTALRRLHTERRRRKLPVQPADAAGAAVSPKAKTSRAAKTTTPDAPASTAKRPPAQPTRKLSGRSKAEPRKTDLRTASRRVAKTKAPASEVEPQTATAAPIAAVQSPASDAKEATKTATKAKRKSEKETAKIAKEAEKATRKAEKKAAKEAEKAAKEAEKAANKAEKKALKAAKEAEKVARKAEKKVAKATEAGIPAKEKGAGKKKKTKG